ncbi:amidohydrolase [Sphingobacterium lactis]|uniref:amidohydrolase n=1 Tax=Sphingobacterium lactis TaxID=797291 RepID=UPI003EC8A376
MKNFNTNLLFLFLIGFFASCTTNKQIDLIVYNAKVYTVDSAFSIVEAFAVNNGVIVELGDGQDLLNKYDAKEKIDAQGKFIYPGFYDAHAHFFMLAEAMDEVSLLGSTSFDEVIARIQDYKTKNPDKKWIIGNGWDQNLWETKDFPTRDSLDKYFPETPIYLTRVDYHAALVNGKALEKAGLDSAYLVDGGLISINEDGIPDGILVDNAMQLVKNHIGLLALGSDFPVEHFNPLYGFHAAVARVDSKGYPEGGFQMENAISREQALRGMTIWAAYSCFQEKKRGSIEKGKDADFIILEEDIMAADVAKLRNIKTLRTVIAGESVFIRNAG